MVTPLLPNGDIIYMWMKKNRAMNPAKDKECNVGIETMVSDVVTRIMMLPIAIAATEDRRTVVLFW